MTMKAFSALALAALMASTASAIIIDGDFSDFTSDMIVAMDDGSGTGLYITDIRVTNDDDFVYINYNYSAPAFASGQFTAIDVDQSPDPVFTGFDFFGLGLGIDAAFQNDFPFQPAGDGTNELFNANGTVLPASFFGGDGVSLAGLKTAGGDPLFGTFSYQFDDGTNPALAGVEFSLAIDGTLGDGTPLFTFGEEFGLLVGGGSLTNVLTGAYTPVAVPEPTSFALVGLAGMLSVLGRRRR